MNNKSNYSQRKLLRISFPDVTVICYKNVTMTFVEAIRKIGVDNLENVHLDIYRHQLSHERFMKDLELTSSLLIMAG